MSRAAAEHFLVECGGRGGVCSVHGSAGLAPGAPGWGRVLDGDDRISPIPAHDADDQVKAKGGARTRPSSTCNRRRVEPTSPCRHCRHSTRVEHASSSLRIEPIGTYAPACLFSRSHLLAFGRAPQCQGREVKWRRYLGAGPARWFRRRRRTCWRLEERCRLRM